MGHHPADNPWEPGARASDVPITANGGEPGPFADLDDRPSLEDELYSNSDIDTKKTTVTFIKDKTGAEMRRVDMTLPQLAKHIRFQTAASKMELPWLKLALFENKRSQNNSLRTNENVLQITGVEVEHDSGEIAFSTALATILKAGIRCIIYTSPSYVPGAKERWRILVPLSLNREPEVREKFVARVNGLFGGKVAPESFVLSQAYPNLRRRLVVARIAIGRIGTSRISTGTCAKRIVHVFNQVSITPAGISLVGIVKQRADGDAVHRARAAPALTAFGGGISRRSVFGLACGLRRPPVELFKAGIADDPTFPSL